MESSGPAAVAVVLTAVTGAIFGFLGWWQQRTRDRDEHATAAHVAEATATDVATRASTAAVKVMQSALDLAANQIADLTLTVAQIPLLRAEIEGLRVAHDECEARNATLTDRVRELEMAR